MEIQESMEDGPLEEPVPGHCRSDLLHHVDAIALALKNWNDTEALKLLRLYWPEISRALREPTLPQGIPVVLPQNSAACFVDRSGGDDVHLPTLPFRTAS
jgi:hypothetical protein